MSLQLIHRPHGFLEFATGLRDFRREYLKAQAVDPTKLMVLPDSRPAVALNAERTSYITLHEALWAEIERIRRRGGLTITKRERACPQCGVPMRMTHEYTDVWTFQCPQCNSIDMQGKQRVGGTAGAGEEEKT